MSGFKIPTILFFLAGMVPTEDEKAEALAIGTVRFRNVSAMLPTDKPERNVDGVAGLVPVQYKDYPVVTSLAEVMEIMQRKQELEAQEDAARDINPSVEIVGKKGKGASAKTGEKVAKATWSANA